MLIEVLKTQFPDLVDLRVREIEASKQSKKINCVISYPQYDRLDSALKDRIVSVIKNSVPKGFTCYVSFVNDFFSSESLLKTIFSIIQKHLVQLCVIAQSNFSVLETGKQSFKLTVKVDDYQQNLLTQSNFSTELKNQLNKLSCCKLEIEILQCLETVDLETLEKRQQSLLEKAYSRRSIRPLRRRFVDKKIRYIGREIDTEPIYIAEIRQPLDSVTIFGKILNKTMSPTKSDPNLQLYKFMLQDESATIPVVFFVRYRVEDKEILKKLGDDSEKAEKKSKGNSTFNENLKRNLSTIYDGIDVILRGKVVFNDYSNRYEVHGFDLSKCSILERKISTKKSPCPQHYTNIFPVSRNVQKQVSFANISADISSTTEEEMVVCYANTTGKNIYVDKILDICMVKIFNGHIVETLNTFLNTETRLDTKIIEQVGMDLSKINSYPTISEIVGDLYKFCFGSTIVGVEIDVVMKLLTYFGSPFGYVFDNKQLPLNELFESLFLNIKKPQKPKTFALLDVAKALQVEIDMKNTHSSTQNCLVAAKCIEKAFELSKN